ncbi:MAG: DUF642 domain-containing protein [Gammaproteobacteria bacterium]
MRTSFSRCLIPVFAIVLSLAACDTATMTRMNDTLNELAGAAPGINLVVNGSFEEPVVPKGGYVNVKAGQSFPGWQVFGGSGIVSPISGDYSSAGIRFNAEQGSQWLDMTGPVSNSATGVQQAVRTQPGTAYSLVFYVGNVSGGSFGTTSSIEVLVDGKSLGIARNDNVVKGQQSWKRFDMPVKAAGSSTTIAFINRDTKSDNSCGLDNVSLIAQTAK